MMAPSLSRLLWRMRRLWWTRGRCSRLYGSGQRRTRALYGYRATVACGCRRRRWLGKLNAYRLPKVIRVRGRGHSAENLRKLLLITLRLQQALDFRAHTFDRRGVHRVKFVDVVTETVADDGRNG